MKKNNVLKQDAKLMQHATKQPVSVRGNDVELSAGYIGKPDKLPVIRSSK